MEHIGVSRLIRRVWNHDEPGAILAGLGEFEIRSYGCGLDVSRYVTLVTGDAMTVQSSLAIGQGGVQKAARLGCRPPIYPN